MQKTHTDYINAALDILDHSLPGYIEARLQVRHGDHWFDYVRSYVDYKGEEICWDTQTILKTMRNNWNDAFHAEIGDDGRNYVHELLGWRNKVAHRSSQKPIDYDAAYRAVDTVWRLLSLVGLPQAQEVRSVRDELQAQNTPVPAQKSESGSFHQEHMLLTTGYGDRIEDADDAEIANTINNLSQRGDDGNNFAVLEANPMTNDYMQTAMNDNGTFCVEYREHSNKKHYSVDGVPSTLVISLLQLYRARDAYWKNAVAWEDISETMEW